MARLTSRPPFIGTVGPVTIYQMYDEYYLRTRSSLDAKRVKTDPAFRKTMQYANLMATASPIGSIVYAQVPLHRKKHKLYRKITGEAMTWLKYQWQQEEVIEYLLRRYAGKQPAPQDGAATKLIKSSGARNGSTRLLRALRKKTARPFDELELRTWQRRTAAFRKEYFKTFTEFDWSATLMRPD
ncbi:hypothetical protein [Paraflavitalea sp. CAU 1676]|uniref:hypothetical protein n=1 Tax=Paraflavitalea sp. CAU 1676 TaxID=3032598 RepID=UPI0023DB2CA4|nr:hypothetical protein [Paraflavitalea sp. CAU 1676]MDF2187617.1 hypothetical protein [Paraflavitalea sp. CAU 1676]